MIGSRVLKFHGKHERTGVTFANKEVGSDVEEAVWAVMNGIRESGLTSTRLCPSDRTLSAIIGPAEKMAEDGF